MRSKQLARRVTVMGVLIAVSLLGVTASAQAAFSSNITSIRGTYDKTWHWKVTDTAANPTVTVAQNGTTTVNYTITAATDGSTLDHPVARGEVVVGPDSESGSTLHTLDGLLFWDAAYEQLPFPVTDCAGGLPQSLASSITCAFAVDVPDVAKATFVAVTAKACEGDDCAVQAISSSPTIDWSTETIAKQIDRCVTLTGGDGATIGTACAGDGPKTFTVSRTLGPYSTCGDYQASDTVNFTTNDTHAQGSAIAPLAVKVTCPVGATTSCALAAYWKDHGGAAAIALAAAQLKQIKLGTAGGAGTFSVTNAFALLQILTLQGSNRQFAPTNGVNQLYASLVSVKAIGVLGGDISSVSGAISGADAFLATHDSTSWKSLTNAEKTSIDGWKLALDRFITAFFAPRRCT
jgi:hypothetical protein